MSPALLQLDPRCRIFPGHTEPVALPAGEIDHRWTKGLVVLHRLRLVGVAGGNTPSGVGERQVPISGI